MSLPAWRVKLGWHQDRLTKQRRTLKILSRDQFRTEPRKVLRVELESAVLDRLDVVVLDAVVRCPQNTLVEPGVVNSNVRAGRLADERGRTMLWLAGLAKELVNVPNVALVLEARTIGM